MPRRHVGIVISRFHEELTRNLLRGATDALGRRGVHGSQLDVVWVPGAFEIPTAIHALATSRRYRALVALGVLIHGETDHYDVICREVSRGIAETARTTGVPVGFGVIMARQRAQAEERAGGRWNLGAEAAEAAAEMAHVMETSPCAGAARRANTR